MYEGTRQRVKSECRKICDFGTLRFISKYVIYLFGNRRANKKYTRCNWMMFLYDVGLVRKSGIIECRA